MNTHANHTSKKLVPRSNSLLILLFCLSLAQLLTAQTSKTEKLVYKENEKIKIVYAGLPGNAQDWITIVPHNSKAETYTQWFYTGGKKNGSYTFAPIKAGFYEIRVFHNWPKESYNIKSRYVFLVTRDLNKRAETLEELAKIFIEEGSPSLTGPRQYTTSPEDVIAWLKFLRENYDATNTSWKKLIDAYFYPGNLNNHVKWKGFPDYVKGKVMLRSQQQEAVQYFKFFTDSFAMPLAVWKQVMDGYHKDGLYKETLSAKEKADIGGYIIDQLLYNANIQKQLSAVTKDRLKILDPLSGKNSGPIVRAANSTDTIEDCSPSAVIKRLRKQHPAIEAYYLKAQMNPGTRGSGVMGQRIRAIIDMAVKDCERRNGKR